MPARLANREGSIADAARYERHRPEHTLLYRLVERHYPAFLAELEVQGHWLPKYVQQEFDGFLKCGRLEHGFLRVRGDADPALWQRAQPQRAFVMCMDARMARTQDAQERPHAISGWRVQ